MYISFCIQAFRISILQCFCDKPCNLQNKCGYPDIFSNFEENFVEVAFIIQLIISEFRRSSINYVLFETRVANCLSKIRISVPPTKIFIHFERETDLGFQCDMAKEQWHLLLICLKRQSVNAIQEPGSFSQES